MRHLRVPGTCIAVLAAVLSACGGGDGPSPLARTSQPAASAPEAGPTPFISEVAVSGKEFDKVSSVHFVVSPLAGTVSPAGFCGGWNAQYFRPFSMSME